MKTLNFISKSNKTTWMICLILLMAHSPVFSQNKTVALLSSINFSFAVPIACVFVLAVFLLTSFFKQKNH